MLFPTMKHRRVYSLSLRAGPWAAWQSFNKSYEFKKNKRWQLHQGMPLLNVLDCGATAHSATAKNSPSAQTVWLSYAPFRQAPQRLTHDSLRHALMQLRFLLAFISTSCILLCKFQKCSTSTFSSWILREQEQKVLMKHFKYKSKYNQKMLTEGRGLIFLALNLLFYYFS